MEDIELREELKKVFLDYGIVFGEFNPSATLRILYDLRDPLLSSNNLSKAATLMWHRIKKYNPSYLVGKGMAASILMSAIKICAENENYQLKILIARSERKKNNRRRLVEGPHPDKVETAIFVDDLMNSGKTYRSTLDDLSEEKIELKILACCLLVDFWDFAGSRRLEIQGLPVEPIFYRHDFGDTRKDPENMPLCSTEIWRNLRTNQWSTYLKVPPLIYKDFVYYLNDRHEVYCHDLLTGNIIWCYFGLKPFIKKGIGSVPQIVNDILYFTSYDGTITALNYLTGCIVWKKYLDMFMHCTPFIDLEKKQIYLGTEGGISNQRGDIICLDLDTAKTKWTFPTGHVIPCSPMLIEEYVVCGSNDGFLYCLNSTSGELIFKIEIGEVKGRVNYIENTILACTETGKLYAIDLQGNVLWKRNCGVASSHQFLPVHRELGLVYICNKEGYILAYDQHGKKVWLRNLRENTLWNITLKGDELITVSSLSANLYQIDVRTGVKLRHQKLSMSVNAPVDFDENFLAINSLEKGLYLYRRIND